MISPGSPPGAGTFWAGLIGDADRYLARSHVDPIRDGASYNLAALWLDDAEFAEFLRDLYTVIQPRAANAPRSGRTRRVLATVVLPVGEPAPPGTSREEKPR